MGLEMRMKSLMGALIWPPTTSGVRVFDCRRPTTTMTQNGVADDGFDWKFGWLWHICCLIH